VSRFGGLRGPIRRGRRPGWRVLVIAISVVLATVIPTSSSAAASFDAALRVRVTDSTGMPLAGAAVLTTVLWTSKSDFGRFGHPRGRLLHADARGELVVPISLDRRQRAAVKRNGDWASFSVVAFDAAGQPISFVTTSRYLGTKPEKRVQARSLVHADVVRLVQPRGAHPATGADPSLASAASIPSCNNYYWDADSYWNRFAQIGELHADYDVANARFTYGQTADTTFDVVSKAGTEPWSVTGGLHVENTRESAVYAETAGSTNYHWALRTQFRFVNMKLFKDCVGGPYRVWTGSQLAYALEWTGNGMTLSNKLTQPARKSANSAPYGSHSGWARTSGTLVRWSAAVSVWGAMLSAQSGSSSFVKLEYSFGGRPTHYLYGDTGLPTDSKRVFQDTP
jgi:hypothetical protein